MFVTQFAIDAPATDDAFADFDPAFIGSYRTRQGVEEKRLSRKIAYGPVSKDG